MATYYFSGEARYAKVYQPVETYDKEGQEWTIDVKLDDESKDLFEESGCQLRPSKDNLKFYTFRRPVQKEINGDTVNYEAPRVVDANNQPFNQKIGNGSKVTIKVEIYGTRKGKGHRLEAVRVEEHVPFDGDVVKAANDEMVPF